MKLLMGPLINESAIADYLKAIEKAKSYGGKVYMVVIGNLGKVHLSNPQL